MPLDIFHKLKLWLTSYTSLQKITKNYINCAKTRYFFLQIVGQGASNRLYVFRSSFSSSLHKNLYGNTNEKSNAIFQAPQYG